jgi:hypothetical protein
VSEDASQALHWKILLKTLVIIISGYTLNTDYEDEVKDLVASLKKYGLPHKIYPYESRGSWTKNTMVKAHIIQLAMTEFPDEVVVWLDADAIVLGEPKFFFSLSQQNFDLCCHYLESNRQDLPRELLSGTIAFAPTKNARNLVDQWVMQKTVNWDQKILQELVDGPFQRNLTILELPAEYIKIKPKNVPDVRSLQCIVGHKQLSRQQRAKLGV